MRGLLDIERVRSLLAPDANDLDPRLAAYRDDPVGFARDILGVEPWQGQRDILEAIAQHDRVTVRSGNKVGKTCAGAICALWYASTRPGARVVLSAPTHRQIKFVVYREIVALHRRAKVPLGGVVNELPENGIAWPDGREIVGFASDSAERFSGISGERMLFIFDEASGMAEIIFDATTGSLAGGGKLLLLSNPTQVSGTFWETHGRRAAFWKTLHLAAADTPNVKTGQKLIPGLATREWLEEMAAEWGTNSPLYQIRCLGDFPTTVGNAVIGLGVVTEAVQRWSEAAADLGPTAREDEGRPEGPPANTLELGVDPARYGEDESVIVARRGNFASRPYCYRGLDTVQLADKVLEVVAEFRRQGEKPRIKVDVIGVGAGVADQLRKVKLIEVVDVCVGESATIEQYFRLRDQVWFELKDWLAAGGAIPPDAKLEAELAGPTYTITERGKMRVESKDDMKQRLKRSPDRADALALAVHRGTPEFKCGSSPCSFMDG